MAELFETTRINGMRLKNRFVRSATWEGMAEEDGACTPKLIEWMAKLAEGGVGLIITGHAYVQKKGQAGPWQLGIYEDRLVAGLREMTDTVHKAGAKIVVQLAHAGLYADPDLTGRPPLAPSAVSGFTKSMPQEMTAEDIRQLVKAFGLAAERAKTAGFDGVQIHGAHGYLLSQFLSPAFNQRTDQYGGAIANRARTHLEVLSAIRKRVGRNYPVLIKMNCGDFMQDGLELNDAIETGRMLMQAGIDAIEISGGTGASGKEGPVRTGILSEAKEAYFKDAAAAFKKQIDLPIILVGGIRSLDIAQQIINDNIADYISMSRPFIREPDLINRWQSGNHDKATCLSDSKCFAPARTGRGIYCVVEKRLQDKQA